MRILETGHWKLSHKWSSTAKGVPQGLKPSELRDVCGTTKVVPFYKAIYEMGSSVVSLKFIEEQPQILRLTTPELKDVRGPVRSE